MQRAEKLHTNYDDLRTDLLEEVAMVDNRIIKPASEAKDCIQPMKKVIKKRGDKKVSQSSCQTSKFLADVFTAGLRKVSSTSG